MVQKRHRAVMALNSVATKRLRRDTRYFSEIYFSEMGMKLF